MLHLIAIHPFVALLILFIASLIVAWIVEVMVDHWAVRMPEASDIEPGSLSDPHPCAWCQKEQAIKAMPHESHGICQRHYEEMCKEVERITKAA